MRCNSPYPCKTKDGTKATMHRLCDVRVSKKYVCQSCFLRPLKYFDDKRIFACDVYVIGNKVNQRPVYNTVQNGNLSDIFLVVATYQVCVNHCDRCFF